MAATDPYLSGNYAPQLNELTAFDLKVEGELPRDLGGVYVRNGSNPRYPPKGRYHWFDGDGMVHSVHFEAGKAAYRNRFVRTRALAAEEAAGGPLFTGIMEPLDFENPLGVYKDTANTDLVFHGGQMLALWWLGGKAHVIDLPNLHTRGIEKFGGELGKGMCAHPKVDPQTGEMMFIDYAPLPPYLTYGVISKDRKVVHKVEVDLPGPRLQHDIAITPNFTVLMNLPMYFDPEKMAQGKTVVRFYRDQPSRFGIIPRKGEASSIRWFDAQPGYVYHTVNAWEDGSKVVMVGCRIDNPLANDKLNPVTRRAVPTLGILRLSPVLVKWTFDLETGTTKEETLDDTMAEFPKLDMRRLGQHSRFSYHQRVAPADTLLFDGVIRYDLERGTSTAHTYEKGWYGGETSFCPRVGGTEEDDGFLCTFVVHEETGESELHVLDAKNLADAPLARVKIPQRVPTGYHSWWVSGEELERENR